MKKIIPFLLLAFFSCKQKTGDDADEEVAVTGTPVTLTAVEKGPLQESVQLNAVSSFQLKTNVKANANGYLQELKIKLGDRVSKGDELFVIKTKEALSLGDEVSKLDTSFHFKGTITVRAPGSGYITSLDHQSGDYVQDGDQVLTVSDASSFVFLLELPYELNKYLPQNNSLDLLLPDSTSIKGQIVKAMPSADAASQTQSYIIKAETNKMIPENLIAKVKLVKRNKKDAVSLPKEAVLTNEVQSEFWIMKMLNDSTAVKVPVKKGIEADGKIEIVSPPLSETDRILLNGNYGLSDTAKVKVNK